MQNQDYLINLATAMANGLIKEEFELFCFLNEIEPCDITLKFFLTQTQQQREREKSSSCGCFFVVRFEDMDGKLSEVREKNENEARKLLAILRNNGAQLFKTSEGGPEQQIA